MEYLPLFHNLRNKPCLVVGGGHVAARKLRTLCEAGASITLVAPQINSAIQVIASEYENTLIICQRVFQPADINDVVLAVVATGNHELNKTISILAQAKNIDVNVVDRPELCSVIFPAIVNRAPMQVAISSGGAAPVLVRLLRAQIESLLPAGLGKLAELASSYRDKVKAVLPTATARKVFWEAALNGEIPEQVYSGNDAQAASLLEQRLAAIAQSDQQDRQGEVYLVGGGPGDPDLLTFRALRLMQQADVVLYDRLVSPQILDMVRRDAERIYVGKKAGDHAVSQSNINDKLVELAREGKRVLRLKGGDPFIFGRGGEEIEQLAEQGIRFQVVPGITAASGCASYAGIPLTHRDHAQSVRFITGHKQDGHLNLDWPNLVNDRETLVFYMSLTGLEDICARLIEHGLSAATPAALVAKGTTAEQTVLVGDLASLPDKVRQSGVRAPTLLIIGQVVSLHKQLAWFKNEQNTKE
ncbi:MAG: uroporphyrinogen-III C-methyltransferase [Gammaproteobacteria bacterium]|nr:MAG: uroporphyrinogen-III C-methyltransferase [Gammaproteobacteria bacterium]